MHIDQKEKKNLVPKFDDFQKHVKKTKHNTLWVILHVFRLPTCKKMNIFSLVGEET